MFLVSIPAQNIFRREHAPLAAALREHARKGRPGQLSTTSRRHNEEMGICPPVRTAHPPAREPDQVVRHVVLFPGQRRVHHEHGEGDLLLREILEKRKTMRAEAGKKNNVTDEIMRNQRGHG